MATVVTVIVAGVIDEANNLMTIEQAIGAMEYWKNADSYLDWEYYIAHLSRFGVISDQSIDFRHLEIDITEEDQVHYFAKADKG